MSASPSYPGAPRWVKVLGIVTVILILLVVLLLATGEPGSHGPGRHAPAAEQTLPRP